MPEHDEQVHVGWLIAALITWFLSAFLHGLGLTIASKVFIWAGQKGNLHPDGGAAGVQMLERLMGGAFGGAALVVVLVIAFKLRKLPRGQMLEAATPWVAWITLTFLIWKCFIVLPTELIHFGQYFVVGFMMAWALGKGSRPQAAFLITFALGLIDELFQHYYIAQQGAPFADYFVGTLTETERLQAEFEQIQKWMSHWMDWTDPILDALGACGGILPFVTLRRMRAAERGEELPETWGSLKAFVIVLGLLTLPLLLLDPATVGDKLGHYRLHPYWGEYANNKPTHWPAPTEGVPVMLACLVVLGLLLEPRKRPLSQRTLAFLLILALIAVDPPSRKKGQPVHERVPHAQATWIDQPIRVDGVLDEPSWKRAQRLGPFRLSKTGKPTKQETYAYVLWSNQGIYFAFECYDDDIWGRDTTRDDHNLYGDEVVEIFLDDGGDEITYFEFEITPKNVVFDLLCMIPGAPLDFSTDQPFLAHKGWDSKGMKSAVSIDGTLHTMGKIRGEDPGQSDTDRRWTVEVFVPWLDLKPIPEFGGGAHRSIPPKPGDKWRLNLYRVDRPRARAEEAEPQIEMTLAEVTALLGKPASQLTDLDLFGKLPNGNYVRWKVLQYEADQRHEDQAWSPVFNNSFHRPPFFGVLEFVK